jgi:hypothetical protein
MFFEKFLLRDKWNSNDSFIGDRSRFADKLLPSLGNVGPDEPLNP